MSETFGEEGRARTGRIQIARILRGAKRCGSPSDGPYTHASPDARRRWASRSRRTLLQVSGTVKKCTSWTTPPTMSWIQNYAGALSEGGGREGGVTYVPVPVRCAKRWL